MRGGWSTRKNRTQGQLAPGGLPCSPKGENRRGQIGPLPQELSWIFRIDPLQLQGGLFSLCFFPMSAAAARRVQRENQICTEITRLVTNKYACPTVFCLGGGGDATWTCVRDCSRLHKSRRRLVIGLHDTSVMGRPAQLSIQRDPGHLGWGLPYAASESCPQLRPARGSTERGGLNYVQLHISAHLTWTAMAEWFP